MSGIFVTDVRAYGLRPHLLHEVRRICCIGGPPLIGGDELE